MGTQIIGNLVDKLNLFNIHEELLVCQELVPCVHYPLDFAGLMKSYPLWNQFGDASDAHYRTYDGSAKITDAGIKLTNLANIVKNTFHLQFLKLCRLHEYTSGTFVIPHRDYLDDSQDITDIYTRIYIPVKIQEQCGNSYEEELYQMELGDIVLHDGSLVHSVGNFSSESRFRLELDFDNQIPLEDLFKDKDILKSGCLKLIPRESLAQEYLDNVLNLAVQTINSYNFKDIVVLLSKIHFYKKVNCSLTYDWLEQVVKTTGNSDLLDMSNKFKWCMVDRS